MLRLELDDHVMDLDDTPLLHITEVDWGFPEIRDVSETRLRDHGIDDRTLWFGARVITITGKVAIDWEAADPSRNGRRSTMRDRLSPFLMPAKRPYLYAQRDDGKVVRVRVRADNFSNPEQANVEDIAISFRAPDGMMEEGEETQIDVYPEVQMLGRLYDLIPDRVYPADWGTMRLAVHEGDVAANWTAKIYGPCVGPELENVTLGQKVSLNLEGRPLVLGLGHYVEVDVAEHTVLADGLPENSRWGSVDWNATDWWQMQPGDNWLRMRVASFSPPAHTEFYWRHSYLL